MASNSPNSHVIDLTQLHIGRSEFAANGFAALDIKPEDDAEDKNSGRASSLFGDEVVVPPDNWSISADTIKQEREEQDNVIQSSPTVSSAQATANAASNLSGVQPIRGPELPVHKKDITTGDDSDDDLMIVDEGAIPDHVKARFTENPWRHRAPDIEIVGARVKKEPVSPPRPVIDVDQNTEELEIKDERPGNSDIGSLFGDMFGDENTPDLNPNPSYAIAVAAAAERDDDEAMFVDELVEPTGTNVPGPGDSGVKLEEAPPVASISNGDAPSIADAPAAAAVSHGDNGGEGVDAVRDVDTTHGHDAVPAVSAGVAGSPGAAAPDAGNSDVRAEGNNDLDQDNGDEDADEDALGGVGDEADDDAGDDEAFVISDDQELSDGEQPRVRRRKANRKKKSTGTSRSCVTSGTGQADSGDQPMEDVETLDREDLEEELKVLEAEFDLYTRRKEKGKLVSHDKDHLDRVTQKIEHLKQRIRRVPTAEELAAEGLRRMLDEDDSGDENGQAGRSRQKRPASRIPAIAKKTGSPGAAKRKPDAVPTTCVARAKRQKRVRVTKANLSKTTQVLLEMVRSNDPIAARAQMDDVQVFTDFKANTLKEQIQKLKEQIRADPDGDQRRINADLKQLAIARKAFGRKFCKPKDGQWLITGMTKLLHHYQLVGAGWMLRSEVSREPPFGGILADSVGLGKTIEAIACIVGNPQSEEDRAEGKFGTLVVVPSTLVGQWQDEINACCPDITVAHYHSSKSHRVRMSNIRKADIVVTTYYEIAKGYPNKDKLKRFEGLGEPEAEKEFSEALGELFTVEWHRVILDEAHAIKNGGTHTSKACIQLKGKYRWALTATPLHNGLHEVLPYMQFVGAIKPDLVVNPTDRKSRRPQVTGEQIKLFLEHSMMVRKIDSLFLGKALFEIPMTHPLPNVWISLSEEEFLIYKRIEETIRRRINKAQAMPGAVKKRYTATFFSLAIRLRQAVSHPFTLFYLMRDIYDLNDIKSIRKQLRVVKSANPNRRFVEQVGSWCEKQLANGRIEGEVLKADIPAEFGKGDHGYEFNMDPQLAKIEKLKCGQSAICKICSEPYVAPRKTKCGHIFCRDCIESLIETEKAEGSESISCPACNRDFGLSEIMSRQRNKRVVNPQMPGSDWKGLQPLGDEESAEFLEECDKNVDLAMAPSAKTVMVKDIILKWQREAPDDKIIVFTQWVVVGRILGRMLQQENLSFVYYFGEMTREEKDDNVEAFHAVDEVKIMIASLKCGGQGLNLTCANRVILVDPWWNCALEHQGYGRVFRMGQKKETWFVRLLTRKTIDGRMAKLQAKKLKEINPAIKDFDSTRAPLNFEEVAELFGRVRRDESGKMIEVESDYDTDDEDGAEDEAGADDDIPSLGGGDDCPQAAASGPVMGGYEGEGGDRGGVGFTYGDSHVGGYGIQDLVLA